MIFFTDTKIFTLLKSLKKITVLNISVLIVLAFDSTSLQFAFPSQVSLGVFYKSHKLPSCSYLMTESVCDLGT